MSEVSSDNLGGGGNRNLILRKEDVTGVKLEAPKHYSISQWNGITKYQCNYCLFDTLKLHRIEEHLEEHAPQQEKRSFVLYDRHGNQI